jgi:hypothetical protein
MLSSLHHVLSFKRFASVHGAGAHTEQNAVVRPVARSLATILALSRIQNVHQLRYRSTLPVSDACTATEPTISS